MPGVQVLQHVRTVEPGSVVRKDAAVGVPAQQPRQVDHPRAGRDGRGREVAPQPRRERADDQLLDIEASQDTGVRPQHP
ncbi:hypothetical protein [Actinomadura sp. NBRC 104412]|uniref:hypothetical protein n=1 Tax=Actinomadura sp. NBRC 104412 TaxID=3032203 RepID=UPI0025576B20|nr:hypothetical protein [Actinomadura sp. NBRC 104412]